MHKNKILEKLLAIILIFTLTSANFLFVGESYASSFAEILFGEKSDTGHENIGFDAYFETEEGNNTSVVSDVNNKDLSVSLNLDVRDAGYLKDAKIEIVETEEGNGLNFVLRDMEELPELVQSFENNTVYFRQINCSSEEVKVNLPINYKNEEYVNEKKFTNDALVKFSGIYVDDEGEEHEVSKDVTVNVSWEDAREVRVETGVTKYIDFGAGIILQTLVKIDTQTEANTLPVKESSVEIEVPSLDGTVPSNIAVTANSTAGTNGKTAGNVVFTQDNWSYNEQEGKLNITVNNEKQLVTVDEFADEYLKEADKEVIEEERYCNISSADEYLITYTYQDVQIPEELVTLNTNINAQVTMFGGAKNTTQINNNNYEYILEGKIGEIVSLNIEDETREVSKGYVYSNYNNSEKYETEFLSKTLVNVSYKDIVNKLSVVDADNSYVYKDGTEQSNNDVYYKQISISKENFIEILGEQGSVRVLDLEGNELSTINNETEVNEEGNIVVSFENRPTRLNIEISKPVGEGNLVIANVKAMKNSSLDKASYSNVASIKSVANMRADFDYVEETVDIGQAQINTNLLDTTTKANLVLDRDSLSTLAVNEDVEIKVELNNHTENSDVYGHLVCEIELPEYVQSIELTNASILYGEGLNITSAEVDGKIIRVTVDGKQEGINSGVLSNGTNLVLNANIKVDLYAPAKSEVIKLRYTNDEATNYAENGYTELEIAYSAPTGLVAVNSTSNYNSVGAVTTSVRQGTIEDLIDIYAEAKVATMEIIVMNNNGNTVSNVSILGRIPFEGVKDIATGEDLGTTLNTKFVSGLVPDEHNTTSFDVYYSENGEANNNLEDSSNGWVMNPENLENMKSYLIVPQDSNYEMQDTEILRFTYEYEIPGNLTHNENIYGTFQAYFTNNSEVATTDETTTPDKVGLTTGEGPEISIAVDTDRNTVKEEEEMRIDVTVSNLGNNRAEEIVVNLPIPENSTYNKSVCEDGNISLSENDGNIVATCSSLEIEKEMKFSIYVKAGKIPSSKSTEELYITPTAAVTAKDLGTTLETVGNQVQITETELSLEFKERNDIDEVLETQKPGAEVGIDIIAKNETSKDFSNAKVEVVIPEELSLSKAVSIGTSDGFTVVENEAGNYDEASRTVTFDIGTLKAKRSEQFKVYVTVNSLPEEQMTATATVKGKILADSTETYDSNAFIINIGKSYLTVTQSASIQDTYIKEGDQLDYIFTIKNEGTAVAENVTLVDEVPEGLKISKISYVVNGVEGSKRITSNRDASISATVHPGAEFVVTISTVVSVLNGIQELSITNTGTLSSTELEATQTNSITHIIEQSESIYHGATLLSTTTQNNASSNSSNVTKTYRISGTAWNDADRDGMRSTNESLLSGIKVSLVNSETGVIQKSITTDSAGSYTFSGIENGNYLIVFDYDTARYTVTSYKKDGVSASVNSDAIITKVDQDGVSRTAAITDVITVENGSVSGIDIGLVLSDKFDLKLDKEVTKVMVQNANGATSTDEYEGTTFAKTEIASKYLSGSTVYIEYKFTVTNAGEIAGYAKKLVDYIPEGMTFNSSLEANKDWYTGTDGNLYSTAFADIELAPGESKTIKLVLTKQVTEENTGIVNNLAEICEDYNIYGISDINSTPGNKAQGENDLGSADVAILIKTGEQLIYISVIITTILLGSIVVFIAYNKIVLRRKKGGV